MATHEISKVVLKTDGTILTVNIENGVKVVRRISPDGEHYRDKIYLPKEMTKDMINEWLEDNSYMPIGYYEDVYGTIDVEVKGSVVYIDGDANC